MNERDKIIEIAKVEFDIQFGCGDYIEIGDKEAFAENLVDALFKAGIGDVAEWKRRAEVAERALEYAVSEYRCDECPCIDCNAEIRGSQECVNLIAKTYKEEAERDIEREIEEEERK